MARDQDAVGRSLDETRIVNAHSWATMFGGSTLRPSVLSAMARAAQGYHDIYALQDALGRRVAELTDNEAAYLTNGAAAGVVIALLACLTRGHNGAIADLPADRSSFRVVFQRCQRNPYDRALQLAGAMTDWVGTDAGASAEELDAALDRHPVACFFALGGSFASNALGLDVVVEACRRRSVPVVVDAASQLPPAANLWAFTRDAGADAAVFSGGKELRGPQNSGFIVGSRWLIDAARRVGPPRQTIVRALKVGRDAMCGLVVALEDYMRDGDEARIGEREAVVREWLDAWRGIDGVEVWRAFPNVAGQPISRAALRVDSSVVGASAAEIAQALWDSSPRVAVIVEGDTLLANPSPLDPGDAEIVREAVADALRRPRHVPNP
jgi:L-seryl-tRNA(Ser) seleniumtransferase